MNFFAFDRITLCLSGPDSANYVSLTQLPFWIEVFAECVADRVYCKLRLQEKMRGIQDVHCLKYS